MWPPCGQCVPSAGRVALHRREDLSRLVTCGTAMSPCPRVAPSRWKGRPVATWRVIYVPRFGVRLLTEDVEADAVRETTAHPQLTLDMLVVGQPREVIALRVRRPRPARRVLAGLGRVNQIDGVQKQWRRPGSD